MIFRGRILRGAALLISALLALTACAVLERRPAVCSVSRARGDGVGAASDVLLRLVSAADRGMGGTGISTAIVGADQRGMGGTGVMAQNNGRGMGGTGIIGVVTGFGSICVNGYEIEMADATAVTVESLPATAGDIELGQVVEVEAFRSPEKTGEGKLTAASVNVRMTVAGPVSSVAADGATAVIAGQIVRRTAFTRNAAFTVGEWVAVSGLRRGDDVVVATSISVLPQPGREVLVAGPVRLGTDGKPRIGALLLDKTQVAVGQAAVVRGDVQGTVLNARTVLVEAPPDFTSRVATLSVEGFATTLDASQIRVGSITAGVAQNVLTGVLRTDLGAQVVQLEGRIGAVGVFAPDRIILSSRPFDGVQITRPDRFELLPGSGGRSVITILPSGPLSPIRPEMVPGTIGGTSPATKP